MVGIDDKNLAMHAAALVPRLQGTMPEQQGVLFEFLWANLHYFFRAHNLSTDQNLLQVCLNYLALASYHERADARNRMQSFRLKHSIIIRSKKPRTDSYTFSFE